MALKGFFPDRVDDRYCHYQCRHDVCDSRLPKLCGVGKQHQAKRTYRQAISWARTELVRLQTQLASGEAAAELEDEWDEAGEWVAALLADVAGSETASPRAALHLSRQLTMRRQTP